MKRVFILEFLLFICYTSGLSQSTLLHLRYQKNFHGSKVTVVPDWSIVQANLFIDLHPCHVAAMV